MTGPLAVPSAARCEVMKESIAAAVPAVVLGAPAVGDVVGVLRRSPSAGC